MPRLVVVLPLSPMRDGDSFAVKDWPLHITVSPPFLTDAAPSDIADMAPRAATSGRTVLATLPLLARK